ncbi:hypothetical protein QSI_0114 [Clostridioides difficile P28]|nr:hypothetical protein QSI_0114 [Clostridioides difficile P28]
MKAHIRGYRNNLHILENITVFFYLLSDTNVKKTVLLRYLTGGF